MKLTKLSSLINNIKFRYFPKKVQDDNLFKSIHEVPGPIALPFIGVLWKYMPVIGEYTLDAYHHNGLKRYKEFGPIVKEKMPGGYTVVWVYKPQDLEALLRNEGKYPERLSHLPLQKFRLSRPTIYKTGGLLPTKGEEWFRLRNKIQQKMLVPRTVKRYIPTVNSVVDEFLQYIDKFFVKTDKCEDMVDHLSRLYLELTCVLVFDHRLNSFSLEELNPNSCSSRLMQSAFDTNNCVAKLENSLGFWKRFPTPTYNVLKKAQLYMESVAIELVDKKIDVVTQDEYVLSETASILEELLLVDKLEYKDFIGFACDMLLAGIDTTSYTTSFVLYHLAKNSRAQEILYNETLELLPAKDSPVTEHVLENASYLRAVLKESFRLNPVSVGIGRILTQPTVLSGHLLPKGTVIVTQNQVSCRLEEYFENPDSFIPERWIPNHDLYKQVSPFLVAPFGQGARTCIARRLAEQNMKIAVLKIIRNYKLEWKGVDYLDCKSYLINKPASPVLLKFVPRL